MNEKIQQPDQADLEESLVETLPETHIRAQKERARQERLEMIQQERKKLDDLKQLAEFESRQAELFIEGCKNILKDNLAAANSRIKDVDVAEESTQFARYNILVQAGTAMLAQANATPQSALRLLQ